MHQVSVSTAQYKKSHTIPYVTLQRIADDIKQLKSVAQFKLKVKSFLAANCFYIQLETILIVKRKIMFNVTKQDINELVFMFALYTFKKILIRCNK